LATARCISKLASTARLAWSGWVTGALENVMMGSLIYLSTVVPYW